MIKYQKRHLEKIEKLRDLYAQGKSISTISTELKIQHRTVITWLKREGIIEQDFKHPGGAAVGNQNARGNKGGRPRADTNTFNLTLPAGLYRQLETMRLEGYGTKSEILSMFIAAHFEGWSAEVRDLAADLDARDNRRR